ncbi:A/G-specific adenine glycosylase [Commensalibacter papalotli (ex Servin-Garciduenas et al. 2014)]|uniref:Adenine DNA glycosylase n=1 Tax=Commensalibacter papalotli (ex Servin-Garciduenas et al. 2014) TaxID=1208583 RepID=W7DVW5_9PROT|nr:A/G-specific adenine glycosylase [Commensalibacter papalotli (ex Servin-Garciduenas et al. 2014)]EUK19190.1 A/G-specific adenine glycosylase [Commensalibacter papalotli (ex Servin-Garciduenas et al. 2014)]
MSTQNSYATLILHWYDQHQRILPWRAKTGTIPNPYHVLLSEIMLQQTQVATVIPYFNNFIKNFPTLNDMAHAPLDKIMAMWTGLGYYSRARNLHRCVQEIVKQGGAVPKTQEALKALPGIGEYTSAAILSIGYNQPYVPIDGNVERITARLFAVQEPLPSSKPALAMLAKTLNNHEEALVRPGDFAQGLFDIGATICKPKNPLCLICPLSDVCKAHQEKIADLLPKKQKKAEKPTKFGVSLFIQNSQGQLLFRKRPEKGVLAGTMELPSTIWSEQFPSLEQAIIETDCKGEYKKLGDIKHVFTHFTLKIRLYALVGHPDFITQDQKNIWLDLKELHHYPCSTLMRKMIAYSVKT